MMICSARLDTQEAGVLATLLLLRNGKEHHFATKFVLCCLLFERLVDVVSIPQLQGQQP